MKPIKKTSSIASAVVLLCLSLSVQAQTTPTSKPGLFQPIAEWFSKWSKQPRLEDPALKLEREAAAKEQAAPVAAPTAAAAPTALVPVVKGLVLVASPDKVVAAGSSATGVTVDGVDFVPDSAKVLLEGRIGKPMTLDELQTLSADLVRAYRQAGVQVVNVFAPKQEVTNGTIQLVTVLGKLGKVTVAGNQYYDEKLYTDNFTAKPGEVLRSDKVLEDLRFLNRSDFRRVDLTYSPGAKFGETDVRLEAAEVRPRTAYIGVETSGQEANGDLRLIAGFQLGNLFKKDQEFNYQLTTSSNGLDNLGHNLSYIVPLQNRQELRFNASYAKQRDDTVSTTTSTSNGESSTIGVHYYRPLPRALSFAHDAHLGVDYKKSNNSSAIAGLTTGEQSMSYALLKAALDSERLGTWFQTRTTLGYAQSVGASFPLPLGNGYGNFGYAYGGVDSRHDFEDGGQLTLSAHGQYASDELPDTEQFYLGGTGTVRGFRSGAARGNTGIYANATYYTPNLLKGDWRVKGTLTPYVFIDGGNTNGAAFGAIGSSDLVSAGAGVAYRYGQHFSMDLGYGHRLLKRNLATTDNSSGKYVFNMMFRY